MKQDSRKRLILDLIFIVLQSACIIGLFTIKNYEYMRIALSDLLFWIVYMIFEFKQKWVIPFYVRLVVILAIMSNSFFGELLNWYVTSTFYDRVQHVFGTYAMTLWAFYIIQQFVKVNITQKRLVIIFFIILSIALGAFYEIIEFLQDILFKPKIKNQPSLLDTDFDLIADLIGGIIAICNYLFSKRLKSFLNRNQETHSNDCEK